jgi:hypothetical protein
MKRLSFQFLGLALLCLTPSLGYSTWNLASPARDDSATLFL